ncbi:hypothetical protein AGR2A_Lc70140 [Agrobacterium genomosp. 2 str. CFBP 5494]|uniref:Uncharacterized protein n=1 Tax=Agrobacterium genomosp. 2 str. CFBP 5494 TaxID=1183436 RepID=A0A9W5F2H5_9HYPH|nr:hypothetical protein AGR2A_Lc70140 [Agrobacterium genomosp. 2 str. CFBP 5494]
MRRSTMECFQSSFWPFFLTAASRMDATSTLPVEAGAAVVGAGEAGAAGAAAVVLAVPVGVPAGAEVCGAASALPKIAFLILSKKLILSSP